MLHNLMSRKFYKLLIIGNPQPTIPHIPNRNNGIMECWNNEIITFPVMNCQAPAAGVYLPEGRQPIIPLFQYSIIPVNCERSELSSNLFVICIL